MNSRGYSALEILLGALIIGLVSWWIYLFIGQPKLNPHPSPIVTPSLTEQDVTPTDQHITNTPSPEVNNTRPMPTLAQTYEKILTDRCQVVSGETRKLYYGIEPNDIPITINNTVFQPILTKEGLLDCSPAPENIVTLQDESGNTVFLYSVTSEELGHAGASAIGVHGALVQKAADTQLYIYLKYGDSNPVAYNSPTVQMRGVKTVSLSNGQTVYLSYDQEIIPSGNETLTTLLYDYSIEKDIGGTPTRVINFSTITVDDLNEIVADKLFYNLDEIPANQKEVVTKVRTTLEAFLGK